MKTKPLICRAMIKKCVKNGFYIISRGPLLWESEIKYITEEQITGF